MCRITKEYYLDCDSLIKQLYLEGCTFFISENFPSKIFHINLDLFYDIYLFLLKLKNNYSFIFLCIFLLNHFL